MSKYFSSVAESFPDVKSKYFDYDKSSKCIKRMLPKEKGKIVVQFIEKAISRSLIGDKRVKKLVDKAFEKLYEKKHKKSYKESIKKAKELHKTYKIKVKDLNKAQKKDPKKEAKKTALKEAKELFAKMPHEIADLIGSYLIGDILKEVKYNFNDERIESLKDWIQARGPTITSLDLEDHAVTHEQLREIVKTFPNLEKFHFVVGSNQNHDQIAKLLSKLKNLKNLKITPKEFTPLRFSDAGFEHLSKLTKLERLFLCYCSAALERLFLCYCSAATDQGVQHLNALTELTSLSISGYYFTDQSLAHLGKLNKLTSLEFHSHQEISAAGLQHLAALDLRTLKMFAKIQNDAVQPLAVFTHLQTLALDLEDDGSCLQHLAPLENLEHLHLSCNSPSHDSMQHVAQFKRLKTLMLYSKNGEFNDNCLEALSVLSELRTLEIVGDSLREFQGIQIQSLAKLSKLCRLQIVGCDRKTAKELHRLKELSKLKDLELSVGGLNDEILQAIATITSLVKVKLGDCTNMTDKGMEHISQLPKLKKLSLRYPIKVTDKGIQHLMKRPLEKFTVENAEKVSKNALKALKKQGTHVRVEGNTLVPK